MINTVKGIRKEFQKNGIFHTPIETINNFSEKLFSYLPKENIYEVYDPTCGVGGLYSIFGDEVKKYGQDVEESFLNYCRDNTKNFEGYSADTLENDCFKGRKFQCIIANPPFSIKWNPDNHISDERFCKIFDNKGKPILPPKSKADYAFIMHIIDKMDDDGIALTISFPGILYRGNAEGKLRTWLLDQNIIEEIFEIPKGSFIDTSIATIGMVFNKNKNHNNIKFTGSKKNKDGEDEIVSIVISRDVIKEQYNDNLSISNFIQDEYQPKESINQDDLYFSMFNGFTKGIELQKYILDCGLSDSEEQFWDYIYKCKKYIESVIEQGSKVTEK